MTEGTVVVPSTLSKKAINLMPKVGEYLMIEYHPLLNLHAAYIAPTKFAITTYSIIVGYLLKRGSWTRHSVSKLY
jgi:hypothetical protein